MAGEGQSLLARLDRWLDRALYLFSGILLLIIAGTVFYAVAARYLFNAPPLWAEDAPRVFFVWLTYIGVAVATRRGQNIRVTHFIDMMPPGIRLAWETFMNVLVLVMIATILYWSFPVLELQLRGTMLSTGWSYAWFYAPLPISCALMLLYTVRNTVAALQAHRAEG